MTLNQFIHLRNFSAYSLSEGAIKIPQLIDACLQQKMPAIGVCDRNNLFGALEFALSASKAGVQPIIGVTLSVLDDITANPNTQTYIQAEIPLIAKSKAGYLNLLKIISSAYLYPSTEQLPSFKLSQLKEYAQDVIALTGGIFGHFGLYYLRGEKEKSKQILSFLKSIFEDRLYLEVTRHGTLEEKKSEPYFIDQAYGLNIPLVATQHSYFLTAKMYEAHDIFLCIAQGATISQMQRRRLSSEQYLKTPEHMIELFEDLPEAIENTVVIAKRCSYYPQAIDPILPKFSSEEGRSEADELRFQAKEGLELRLKDNPVAQGFSKEDYERRLDFELTTIENMNFPGYFLIVSDFIKYAKHNDIPVGPGRGSGAGSLVAWSLMITDLDPIRFGLLFERFLNPERVSMPDFDIDFCQTRRDEVISYVQKKYGFERVAQIITFGKFQARLVLRDIGRVLEMPYGQVDRICKLVPNNPANPVTLAEALELEPQLKDAMREDEQVKKLVEIALLLEGLNRHASTHAAGVVIGDRSLDELVPMYKDARSPMPVTQFNMKYVEQAGLVKFDFLGLKTLTVIHQTVKLLQDRSIDLDILLIPLDDTNTFELICRGDMGGVFQLESSGMKDVLKKMKPNKFEEIIALVSLYRPGPMDNIPKYIRVKNGEEEADYMDPSLEPILKETFGIMIYQEQVMQIAQILAGYTLGGADLLRRAMGKKIKAEMDAQRKLFVEGSVKNKVTEKKAGLIFDQVAKFAGYGFNKSHAAAYALVSYQTAFLKANYPVEFMAATMNFELTNTDKLKMLKQELKSMGIPLLRPDVQKSSALFTVEPDEEGVSSVRYALAGIKGVGEAAVQLLVDERKKNGPFKDVFDFAERLDTKVINKRQLESLISAGAMDCFKVSRAKLFENVDLLTKICQMTQSQKNSGQSALFDQLEESSSSAKYIMRDIAPWSTLYSLKREQEVLGFYLTAHPLDSYTKILEKLGVSSYMQMIEKNSRSASQRFKLAGIVTKVQFKLSKRGKKFAFVSLSDQSQDFEITIFSEMLVTHGHILEEGKTLLISAELSYEEDNLRLNTLSLQSLDEVLAKHTSGYKVRINSAADLAAFKKICDSLERGSGALIAEVEIVDPTSSQTPKIITLELMPKIKVNPDFRSRIEELKSIELLEEI